MTWKQLSYTQRQAFNYKIQRNTAITYDSFLNFGQSITYDYYSTNVANTDNVYDYDAKQQVF